MSQRLALILLVVIGLGFALTLGAGLLSEEGPPPDPEAMDPDALPAWTGWLDRATDPFRPRLEMTPRRHTFSAPGQISIPRDATADGYRIARIALLQGAGRLRFVCRCEDPDQSWPEEGSPNPASARFLIHPRGGTLIVTPETPTLRLRFED